MELMAHVKLCQSAISAHVMKDTKEDTVKQVLYTNKWFCFKINYWFGGIRDKG